MTEEHFSDFYSKRKNREEKRWKQGGGTEEKQIKMKFIDAAAGFFKFDRQDTRFELLEREQGEPSHWGGWNDVYTKNIKEKKAIPAALDEKENFMRSIFRADINSDIVFRKFNISGKFPAMIVYIDGMAKGNEISQFLLKPLLCADMEKLSAEYLIGNVIEISEAEIETDFNKVIGAVTEGKTVLLAEGAEDAVVLETRGFEKRAVTTSENEKVVRGPKEGFTENLRTNITLIRRIIHTDDLIAEFRFSGGDNNTKLAIVYREGVTNRELIGEIKRRIAKIDIRMLESTGVIEQLIEDNPLSPVPQILSTERPDRAASFVMQGAAALLLDGSPFALIMPITLSAIMSSPEDIYMRKPLGSVLRLVRYSGALISLLLPAYFTALAMYHQGMLSTEVLSTVIQSRKMVFEPLPLEMLLLLFVFQLIREAGMRVPGSVGQAIGVIGGLILGQAAIAANLASSVILIVVAISGLGNFCVPDYSAQISFSYFRIAFVIAAWMGGLLGLVAASMLFIAYLSSLKSFGVPFMTPFAPKTYTKRPYILRGSIGMHKRGADYYNACDDTLKKKRENAINGKNGVGGI